MCLLRAGPSGRPGASADTVGKPGERRKGREVYCYILECADGTLYTGWTTDLERRLKAHNAGRGGRYTRIRRPVKLVYSERLPDRSAAMRRELAIKRCSRASKLSLIQAQEMGKGHVKRATRRRRGKA